MDQQTNQTPPQTSPANQSPPVTPETPPVPKPKSKLLIPFLVIFILLLVSVGAYAYYKYFSSTCVSNGIVYNIGDGFDDGCNSCTCTREGAECTLMACIDEDPIIDGEENATILFEKEEGWGPCPPDSLCTQKTTLYNSGELVTVGEENTSQTLDQETLNNIKAVIRSLGVMNKQCLIEEIVDYSATYTINLDGATKVIKFPGCNEELQKIEKLL